jgi:hypothetical protein
LVRKYEDEYVTVDNNDNFAYKVWLKQDTSGNNFWRCSEVFDNEDTAGTIYSSNLSPSNVAGTDWTALTDDEIIYCNVMQISSGSTTGEISTSAVAKSIDSYPCTFSVPVADITYNDGKPFVVQRLNNDLYTDNYIVTSGSVAGAESFGYKIWTQNVTSAGYEYGVSMINPSSTLNDQAGYGYRTDGGIFVVAKKSWTSANGSVSLYCNFSVTSQSSWTTTIETSPVANAPFASTATFPVRIGYINFSSGVATIIQAHAGLIDYRGRIISPAIGNYDSSKYYQLVGRSSNSLQWYTINDCPSG